MITNYQALEKTLSLMLDNNENFGLVTVKFLDYGGNLVIPANQIRQLRSDFMLLPFQAIECDLDGIFPFEGSKKTEKHFYQDSSKKLDITRHCYRRFGKRNTSHEIVYYK